MNFAKYKSVAKTIAIAFTVRGILLHNGLTNEERERVLSNIGFCLHCGRDVEKKDGSYDNCQCSTAEPRYKVDA